MNTILEQLYTSRNSLLTRQVERRAVEPERPNQEQPLDIQIRVNPVTTGAGARQPAKGRKR